MKKSLVPCIAALALIAGCQSTGRAPLGPDELHPQLTNTAYVEEGKLLALVVGTRIARTKDDTGFIGLEISVANRGLKSLTVTSESFTLVDSQGRSYPVVSGEELREANYNADTDRRIADTLPVLNGRWSGYERIPSNLVTTFDAPVERSPVFLSRLSFMYEILYFPRPEDLTVRGERFELFFDTPELEEPVLIKFKVE